MSSSTQPPLFRPGAHHKQARHPEDIYWSDVQNELDSVETKAGPSSNTAAEGQLVELATEEHHQKTQQPVPPPRTRHQPSSASSLDTPSTANRNTVSHPRQSSNGSQNDFVLLDLSNGEGLTDGISRHSPEEPSVALLQRKTVAYLFHDENAVHQTELKPGSLLKPLKDTSLMWRVLHARRPSNDGNGILYTDLLRRDLGCAVNPAHIMRLTDDQAMLLLSLTPEERFELHRDIERFHFVQNVTVGDCVSVFAKNGPVNYYRLRQTNALRMEMAGGLISRRQYSTVSDEGESKVWTRYPRSRRHQKQKTERRREFNVLIRLITEQGRRLERDGRVAYVVGLTGIAVTCFIWLMDKMQPEEDNMWELLELLAEQYDQVQAVRDEEAVKREALVAEWKEKEAGLAAEADERIERLEKEYKEMISKLKDELETAKAEQEEGESQAGLLKAAEHGLEIQLSELREKLHQAEAEAQKQKDNLDEVVEGVTARHKTEVAELIREHEELLSLSKMQADVERVNLNDTVTTLHAEVEQLKKRAEMAQKELDEERTAKADLARHRFLKK